MLKSLDFNVIGHGEIHMISWSDTGESKCLKAGRSFRDHISTLKEDVVFFLFFELLIMVNHVLKISKEMHKFPFTLTSNIILEYYKLYQHLPFSLAENLFIPQP